MAHVAMRSVMIGAQQNEQICLTILPVVWIHQRKNVCVVCRLTAWLKATFNDTEFQSYNGAKGATQSTYMALCLHVRRSLNHFLTIRTCVG